MLHTRSNFYDPLNLVLETLIFQLLFVVTLGLQGLMTVVPGLRLA